jgi:Ala-tRNA(Pro) deacylase
MSIPRQITEFLSSRGVDYQHRTHPTAFTAQEVAHAQHVSGKALAKTVVLWAGKRMVMAVLPASHHIELELLERLIDERPLRLATEAEFKGSFPACEVGAMPPLGSLYHLEVWVDASLKDRATIFFNAGTHTDTIEMKFADFEKLVSPHLGRFAVPSH